MAEFQEEVYIIERKEITDDEEDDEEFQKLQEEAMEMGLGGSEDEIEQLPDSDSDDDLNDFTALKTKTQVKAAKRAQESRGKAQGTEDGTPMPAGLPKVLERDVVIDDFIRNFL
jgi:hypothetical protein